MHNNVSFGDQTLDAIEKGQLDLMLNADDGYLPPRFASEMIFDDSYSCVAAKTPKHPKVLTLKQYLKVAAFMGGMRRTINGSYAKYTRVPATNVVGFDSVLPWVELAAIRSPIRRRERDCTPTSN